MILGEDPENIQVTNSNTMTGLSVQKVRCKKCRRALAYPENLVDHEPGKGQTSFGFRKRNTHYKAEEVSQS
jgi:dual specificity phosphatase 12